MGFVQPILTIDLARDVASINGKKRAKPRIPRLAIPKCFMAFAELRSGLVSFPFPAERSTHDASSALSDRCVVTL